MIYMSPDLYFEAFEEHLNLQYVTLTKDATAGLELYESSGRVHLQSMKPSTAAAKIPNWHPRLRGAWLIKIGNTIISSIDDVSLALRAYIAAFIVSSRRVCPGCCK
jgi:hypothetical protein